MGLSVNNKQQVRQAINAQDLTRRGGGGPLARYVSRNGLTIRGLRLLKKMLQLRLAIFKIADNQTKWASFWCGPKHQPVTKHRTLKTDQNSDTKS